MTRLVRAVRGVPFVLIGTLAGAGCAVMPPTQPAADLAQIVGTWEGTLVTLVYPAARTFAITTTIHADGTFESIVAGAPDVGPNFPGPTVSGTVYVADGAFRYHWPGNNRDGTFILHEHGQWRVLEQVTDDRTSRARMTPKT